MENQLALIAPAGRPAMLSRRTRDLGRQRVAQARQILRRAGGAPADASDRAA